MGVRLTVELELPSQQEADRMRIALEAMARAEEWGIAFTGENHCHLCGKPMVWIAELGLYGCPHPE